jgi:nucleotide-binding universal stress UspA family protein
MAVHKILVAIDFSETSKDALEFGRLLADACGASLHLLHVIGYPLTHPETLRQEQQDACRRLEALLEPADRERRHATSSCEIGTPACGIAGYAATHGFDLIVMGTHSHAQTFRMTTGSVAEAVIASAPCAVLAVKAAAKDRGVETSNRAAATVDAP